MMHASAYWKVAVVGEDWCALGTPYLAVRKREIVPKKIILYSYLPP
jgi:hypothetical protein